MSTLPWLPNFSSKIVPITVWLIFIAVLAGGSVHAQVTPQTPVQDTISQTKADSLQADTLSVPTSSSALNSEVKYSAKDSIIFDIQAKKAYLYGDAHMEYEDIVLDADFITIDWNTTEISAEGMPDSTGKLAGNPIFKQGDQETRQKKLTYNFKTKRGRINELITKEGEEGFIHGGIVKTVKNEEGQDVIYAKNAKYTTCNLDHPHFWIQTNKLKLIPKDKVITGPAYIVVQEVPIPLILPFGFFPADSRKTSGIIVPEIGNAGVRGFMLRNGGFYFGGSEYFDLALTGDIYTRGDYRVATESRYAKRYRFNGGIKLQYARLSEGIVETPNYSVQESFQVNWQHAVNPKARPGTNFSANVNAGTGRFLKQTTFNTNAILQQTLQSSINYGRQFRVRSIPFNFSSSLNHNQVISTGQVDFTLPNANLSMSRVFPFKPKAPLKKMWYHDIGLTYNLNFVNQLRTTERTIRKDFRLENFNNGFSHTVPLTTAFKVFRYFTLSPSINYNGYFYTSRVVKEWQDSIIVTTREKGFYQAHVWNAVATLNTMFYGMANINRGRIIAARHTVIPSVTLNYRPDYSDPNYGFYKEVQADTTGRRFQSYSIFEGGLVGGPGGGKQGMMSFNLNNNLEMKIRGKDTSEATKKLRLIDNLNIGGSYNFLADSLKLSPITINAFTTIYDKINVQGNISVDPYQFDTIGGRQYRVNRFMWNNGRNTLGRLTTATLTLSTNLNSEAREAEANIQRFSNPVIGYYYNEPYANFNVPWGFGFTYNLTYSKPYTEVDVLQTVGVNGNVNLTKNWKIGGRTNYDFRQNEFNLTEIEIYRDLHCWEMSFRWIPFGQYRSYFFNIHIKAATLRDLKLDKRKEYYEFQ